jgi:hypothetical protein
MIVSPRAANQLRGREPDDVAAILDGLRDARRYTHFAEVDTGRRLFRALIAKHRDGSMVLVSVREAPCAVEATT